MAKLAILGSAAAVPDADHENTHLLLLGQRSKIMIDCVGRPLVRLNQVGLGVDDLSDLILTHFHPDHVGGVPGLLMASWLAGRHAPLRIYGLHHCLERLEDLMLAFHWEDWAGFFPVAFHHLPEQESYPVLDNDEFSIRATPVRHYVPTIGLRIEVKRTGFILAYSSDTVPCDETVRLARDADLLIHEATGDEPLGHSSAEQAGQIAARAGAKQLGLIHYNVWKSDTSGLTTQAQRAYDGPVFLCEDFSEIPLGQGVEARD